MCDLVIVRSRSTTPFQRAAVQLVAYEIAEDRWLTLRSPELPSSPPRQPDGAVPANAATTSGVNDDSLDGLEALAVVANRYLFALCSFADDAFVSAGAFRPATTIKRLWCLDLAVGGPSETATAAAWTLLPGPSVVQNQTRLVPGVDGEVYAVDRAGRVETYSVAERCWRVLCKNGSGVLF